MDISFIKNGDKYYYVYADRVYELNDNTFQSLKNKLILPLNIYFKKCSMEFIGNLVPTLFDESVDIGIKKVSNKAYEYEATLTKCKSMHM